MPVLEDPQQPAIGELAVETRERFHREGESLVREIDLPDGRSVTTSLPFASCPSVDPEDVQAAFESAWLRVEDRPTLASAIRTIRCADLFSGVGGLSVGLEEAAWSIGFDVDHVLAADLDEALLDRLSQNFDVRQTSGRPIEDLVDGDLGAVPTAGERQLAEELGELDVLLAGPPCQGHSDLNNHTRRNDPRNVLFLRVVRFAEICRPRTVLIENVPGVLRDMGGVVERAVAYLGELGYATDHGVVRADEVGVPQSRKRFFLLASLEGSPSIEGAVERGRRDPRPVSWAIGDLDVIEGTPFDTSASHSAENRRRISYLFDHDTYDLPDSERPPCHRDKSHSYKSVYGRMHPDRPAPTITVGFGSTGQGRFVHPSRPRTLTPHEAARVQTFPDWFDFGDLRRGQLQKAIGNAVPPRLAGVLIRELLSEFGA